MIWATFSSQSCFCWLYRNSPFGCKEYNQSGFGVDHLVISMCRVFSCVIGRGCLLWTVRSLGKTLLAFALLHSIFQGQNLPVGSGISWIPTFAFQSPITKRTSSLGVSYGSSCSLHSLHRTVQLQLPQHYWSGIDLDYCDIERFALETNRDHSVAIEIASEVCILDSFVDYEGYSISSKGFLPTVGDIMVIWVKFTHSYITQYKIP